MLWCKVWHHLSTRLFVSCTKPGHQSTCVCSVMHSLTFHVNKTVKPLCWDCSQTTKYLCVLCCVEFDISCVVYNSMWNFHTHMHAHTHIHTRTHTQHSWMVWSDFLKGRTHQYDILLTVTHAHCQAYRYKQADRWAHVCRHMQMHSRSIFIFLTGSVPLT